MDFPHYLDVLRRQKRLVIVGLIMALFVGIFSSYSFAGGKLVERGTATYTSTARLLVGSSGLPLFQTDLPADQVDGYTPQQLAEIYPYLVVSDQVRDEIEANYGRPLRSPEKVLASRPLGQPENRVRDGVVQPNASIIPIIEIVGTAASGEAVWNLTQIASNTFVEYVAKQQTTVPPEQQVTLSQTQSAGIATRVDGGPFGSAALVFLAALAAFLLLAFVADGIRQRQRQAVVPDAARPGIAKARVRQRSASPDNARWPKIGAGDSVPEKRTAAGSGG